MNTTHIGPSIIPYGFAGEDSKLERADAELEGDDSAQSTSTESSGSPPQYEEGSFLRPITTDALNSRYFNDGIVEIVSLTIEPGVASFMPPQYLPKGWNVHFHPEGARYYVNCALRVVTDSDIRDEEVYKLLSKAIAYFGKMAEALETPLPENSEICIRVVMEDEPYCGYYIVDHDTRSEFWLQPAESDDLGFYRVTSETHLLLALEGHYWTHVEYFPHRPVPEPVRQEFIACLRHGQLDHLTSLSSTFPYTVEECEKFITVMAVPEQQARNPYLTSMIGRLMGNITRVRFQAFYGENHARLDRDSYRLYEPKSAPSWLLWIASTLVLRMDEAVVEELNGAFPDRTLIGMLWTKLMAKIVRRWIDSRLIGIALLIISSILLVQPKGQLANYFGLAAIVAALATLLTSMALLHKYQESPNDNAAAGLTTVVEMEHDTYGFQPAAIWWSVPRALSIYSAVLFTLEVFAMVLESCGVPFAVATITVMGLLFLGIFTTAMHYTVRAIAQWVRNRREKEGSAA